MSDRPPGGSTATANVDPTTFAILLNRYFAITEEMTYAYERAAASPVIALARDFSCALFDSHARLVVMWDGTPIHVTGMHLVLEEMIAAFEGEVQDGDIIICNDSYSGNSHIGDLVMAGPVFYDGDIKFWAVAKGHQLDTGAIIPTSMPHTAQNVWQEGTTIPPLRIFEGGKRREDALSVFLRNVRYPDLAEGDLLAQKGCVEVGKKRILEVIEQYGADDVEAITNEMLSYAERRTRGEIAQWPDGEYRGEAWIDSDGSSTTDIAIRARVTISGDEVSVDLGESDPQVIGFLNSSVGNTMAAAVLPILCSISSDIPHNQGCLDCVKVDPGPSGTLTNPMWPASCAGCTCLSGDVIQEAVWKALTQAIPDMIMSGSCKCAGVGFGTGIDRRGDEEKTYSGWASFFSGGGGGATKGLDGWPLIICYSSLGALRIPSLERQELLFPIRYDHLEIEPLAAGAGQWVGGAGIRTEVRAAGGTVENFVFGEGATNPPFGALGGHPGVGGGHYKEVGDTGRREYYSAKGHVSLEEDERWICVSSGGGGYGDPLDRDPQLVADDVRDGLLSLESAEGLYGVVVSLENYHAQVDEDKTAKLRDERRDAQGDVAVVTPTEPNAGSWYEVTRGVDDTFVLDRP